ncbi:MAG: WYL domain-containing protein, partial [Bacteroidales bacterium]
YKNRRMSLKEINERWIHTDYSDGIPIPRRTFHNHREKIQEFFDINIECDRSRSEYYIEDSDSISDDKIRSWLLSSFSLGNMMNEQHRLHDRIMLENIPSGEKFLTPIIEAMREDMILEFDYMPFKNAFSHKVILEPYFIRVFKQRWYIIGRNTSYADLRTYAIDRVNSIHILKEHFDYPEDFRPEEYFKDCFGITHSHETGCKIIIKVNVNQAAYFKTLPLHKSQYIISNGTNYTTFGYYMKITFDLIQELISHGDNLEILEPESLRCEIAASLERALKQYKR